MRIQKRIGVFETNSSSVHTITISKRCDYKLPNDVYIGGGEFGTEFEIYNDCTTKASYLFTIMLSEDDEAFKEHKIRLTEILERHGVECRFEDDESVKNNFYYVDHSDNAVPILKTLLENEELLLAYLFGDSELVTAYDCDRQRVRKGDYVKFVKTN